MPLVSSNVKGDNLSLKTTRARPQISTRLTSSVIIMVVPFDASVSAAPPASGDVILQGINVDSLLPASSSPIGYITSFTPSVTRDTKKVFEIGQHAIVEIVPGALNTNTIVVEKMFLYQTRLVPTFAVQANKGNNILQNYKPFNIVVVDRYDKTTVLNSFLGCWFTSCDYTIKSGQDMVMVEKANIVYSWII